MFVKAQPGHRIAVGLQGDKTVQGRPQAIAAYGQDDLVDVTAGILYQVDNGVVFAPGYLGQILCGGQGIGSGGILAALR